MDGQLLSVPTIEARLQSVLTRAVDVSGGRAGARPDTMMFLHPFTCVHVDGAAQGELSQPVAPDLQANSL